MHSLPLFLAIADQPVILIGSGETADAKRRLIERAGGVIVGEEADARIAFVATAAPEAAAARLKARRIWINVADRPDLCDFTLPAIVDRDPVVVAIGTGGASAGLAAALRQRLEAILPADLGTHVKAFAALRARHPDPAGRRAAITGLLASLLSGATPSAAAEGVERVRVASPDPEELTLRAARLLGIADRVYHPVDMAPAILDRARADAVRIAGPVPALAPAGLNVELVWQR